MYVRISDMAEAHVRSDIGRIQTLMIDAQHLAVAVERDSIIGADRLNPRLRTVSMTVSGSVCRKRRKRSRSCALIANQEPSTNAFAALRRRSHASRSGSPSASISSAAIACCGISGKRGRMMSSAFRSTYSSIRRPGTGRQASTAFKASSSLEKKMIAVKSFFNNRQQSRVPPPERYPACPRNRRTDRSNPCRAAKDSRPYTWSRSE